LMVGIGTWLWVFGSWFILLSLTLFLYFRRK